METISRDDEIVALYWRRDERALEETARRYETLMLGIGNGILENDSDSGECFNDALMAMWNSIPPEKPSSFKAYLAKTMRNLSINKLRDRQRIKRGGELHAVSTEELFDVLVSPENTEKSVEDKLLREKIDEFIRSLSKKKRFIFISRYCLSQSAEKIALDLGISESAVFQDLRALRLKLKEKLSKEGLL